MLGVGPPGGVDAREELLAISTILVLLGLYGVQFLAALLGLFLGVASVSPEIDSGALHAVLARPLSRLQYLLGRFLALAGLLVTSGYRLYGLVPVHRSLEDVFVDLVGEVREG